MVASSTFWTTGFAWLHPISNGVAADNRVPSTNDPPRFFSRSNNKHVKPIRNSSKPPQTNCSRAREASLTYCLGASFRYAILEHTPFADRSTSGIFHVQRPSLTKFDAAGESNP